jgi:hypothetical protein
MKMLLDFSGRSGELVGYRGLIQTDSDGRSTCVPVSIASAINWLLGAQLTEASVLKAIDDAGVKEINFSSVLDCLRPLYPDLLDSQPSDDAPGGVDAAAIRERILNGAVLILSLEIASPRAPFNRTGYFHMLSVIRNKHRVPQVWDTAGTHGFMSWLDLLALLTSNDVAFNYPDQSKLTHYLVPHPKHHCLLLKKRQP